MSAIVAASASDVRARLVSRVAAAGFAILSAVSDCVSLRIALGAAAQGSWLAAGGEPSSVRGFAQLAADSGRPFIALIDDWDTEAVRRLPLAQGGAVVSSSAGHAALHAALAAVHEGLVVMSPGMSFPAAANNLRAQPLSPREREILMVAAAGLSTKAIARRLEVSPNTVKFHLQAAFEKLGAATRTEAVVTAIRRGELSI